MDNLEQRLRLIEDDLAIRQLRAQYCTLLDEGRVSEVVDLFTSDGYFQGLGVAQGHAGLADFFTNHVPFMAEDFWHFIGNETIDLDGDTAKGRSSLQYWASKEGVSHIGAGHYEETFRRVDGKWKFATKIVVLDFLGPLSEGWAGRPFHRPNDPKFLEMQAQNQRKIEAWRASIGT